MHSSVKICNTHVNIPLNKLGMGLVLGQSWMVVPINRRILLCLYIIMYCEVCCCLHIHSVLKVLVMGLVLGMFISITGILLYSKVYLLYNGSTLLLFTCKLHCLQTFEHMSALLAFKA